VFSNIEVDESEIKRGKLNNDTNDLIHVSDNDDDEEDEEDEEDEDDVDEEDEVDDDDDEDDDDDDVIPLDLSLGNIDITNSNDIEELSNEIKTVHLDLNETLTAPFNIDSEISHFLDKNDQEKDLINLKENDTISLKNITLNGSNETDDSSREYRKMPLQKLKDIAVSKGLVADASKLKKNDLLKIIEN
jgi:hypothetical protein